MKKGMTFPSIALLTQGFACSSVLISTEQHNPLSISAVDI